VPKTRGERASQPKEVSVSVGPDAGTEQGNRMFSKSFFATLMYKKTLLRKDIEGGSSTFTRTVHSQLTGGA